MKIRIGILSKPIPLLEDWELEIFNAIIEHPDMEIAHLIFDGRTAEPIQKKGLIARLKPYNYFYEWQVELEKRFFKTVPFDKKQQTIAHLEQLPALYLQPQKKNFVDFFDEEESLKVKNLSLDVILRHEFNIIKGAILNASTYGIWSFHHGDNAINRGGPAGFWEARLEEDIMGITLQRLTAELDAGEVIEKAYLNNKFSFIKNKRLAMDYSRLLLLKNLQLLTIGVFSTETSKTYFLPLYKRPRLWDSLAYLGVFYTHLWKVKSRVFWEKRGKKRYDCWTLATAKGNILEYPLYKIKEIPLPKGVFWADPMLVPYQGKMYVFFENYNYQTSQAKISCGELVNNQLVNVQDVLTHLTHFSYPTIIEENGTLYMIPETAVSRRLELYKCEVFPHQWTLHKTLFEGELIADINYFEDPQGSRWLFMNKAHNHYEDYCNELYIYKIDSLEQLQEVTPHRKNPVKIDTRSARNAGPIFQYKEKLIRPSQQNILGKYGYGLKFNEILTLSLDEYQEEEYAEALPLFKEGISGVHHVHQIKDRFIIDYAYQTR